jgi:glucose/arabinose dehydrogenase
MASPRLDRRTLLVSSASTAVATGLVAAGAGPADAAPRVSRTLATGLRVPWGLAFLPNGDALVGERVNGRIHRVSRRGGRTRVGTIEVSAVGEGGLLGIAVAPTFGSGGDRWVYYYFTSTSADNRIERRRLSGGALGDPELLLDRIPSASNHDGGRLAFGPDGMLYVGTGDAGVSSRSQNLGSLAGKILRMTPTGGVPDGNPFDSLVWSYGHRNVQGLAWDGRGRMWASELGQSRQDELNRILPGRNYGWPDSEGRSSDPEHKDPLVTWRPENCSPSGIAAARGRIWVGALRGEALWSVRSSGPDRGRKVRHFHERFGRIRTVAKAPDGSLWITTSNRDGRGTPGRLDDRVVRITL